VNTPLAVAARSQGLWGPAPPTPEHRRRLTENGFCASFLPEEDKARHLAAVAASQP
jgi:hypothetical protein